MDTSAPASTVRRAVIADLPRLVEMGRQFLAASPWAHVEVAEERAGDLEAVIRRIVAHGAAFVAEHNGRVIGGILGVISPVWCIPSHSFATELAWWVDEEHRGGRVSVRLLRAFEGWAYAEGATGVVVSSLGADGTSRASKLIEALDYKVVERSYWKELV